MVTVIATILSIVGGLNWFLVGALQFDLVAWIFGGPATVGARIIYIIVGLAALWLIGYIVRVRGRMGTRL